MSAYRYIHMRMCIYTFRISRLILRFSLEMRLYNGQCRVDIERDAFFSSSFAGSDDNPDEKCSNWKYVYMYRGTFHFSTLTKDDIVPV